MKFTKDQIFHIYNQGNNHRQLFFKEEDYLFFLWRMKAYLLPFGSIIGWCLMSNHFHWLFYVEETQIRRKELRNHVDKIEYQRRVAKYKDKAKPVKNNAYRSASGDSFVSLNEAIGILERSYSAMKNKEMGWSGSLFRNCAKAKDGWLDEFVTLKKKGQDNFHFKLGNDYAYQCLRYIHKNPLEAGLVKNDIDYGWSSAKDYANLRKGTLCNLDLGRKILEIAS